MEQFKMIMDKMTLIEKKVNELESKIFFLEKNQAVQEERVQNLTLILNEIKAEIKNIGDKLDLLDKRPFESASNNADKIKFLIYGSIIAVIIQLLAKYIIN